MKHKLKIKYYIRYADDFVIFSENKIYLESLIPVIDNFFKRELKLILHPDKVFIKTLYSGVDFLGWVNFFDYKILRTKTKNRILMKISENPKKEAANSYLGLLKHGKTDRTRKELLNCVCRSKDNKTLTGGFLFAKLI